MGGATLFHLPYTRFDYNSQSVIAVFNDEGLGRFDCIGLIDSDRLLQLQTLNLVEGGLLSCAANGDIVHIDPGDDGDLLTLDQGMPTWLTPL